MDRLDKHFKALTKAVYERHGFAYGEILAQWDAILGERLSEHTRPSRIKWPKQPSSARKYGGVLVVQADPGFALELQYEVPRLIERVNGYFGYGAIAGVKIMQRRAEPGWRSRRPVPPEPGPKETHELNERLAGIDDEALRNALARLGRGLKSRQP
ncbi:MAG: DUF721 domain-containing protein [Aestuariivirgaceae bacterium]